MKNPVRTLALSLTTLALSATPALATNLPSWPGSWPTAENPPPPPPVEPLPDLPGEGDDTPPPDQPPPGPGTSPLCQAAYQGRFTRHNDPASLSIQGGDFVINGNHQDYHGLGTCDATSETGAEFQFTLDDDARYVFRGTIQLQSNGTALLNMDEVKAGVVIDHLVMSSSVQ